ncbi:dimethylarginine dimethylaminohydrolase family protein [Nocardioides stalactiti]|uniref:dimethylarginine dimethylaminohydrolase family protein n=1 Tax=Nocardioides stalactiti TaxID=2755356 RepID=UPI001603DE6E|nr:arginine deiminase family protein [Nocardioides stalactiti]
MELGWGRHYAMVEPSQFRVDYAINPFMDPSVQPDPERAATQWRDLVATLERLGARVDVIPARADSPDMVYAMNLGFAVQRPEWEEAGRRAVVLSHMRFPQRRNETPSARDWFEAEGFATTFVGRDGVGAHFEAGDAFPFGGDLLVGVGPRTDELALKHLAADLGVTVRGLRITHPGMYHLDLAFCPLDERRAIVCPDALDPASAEALLALVPEPIVITEEEAITTLCANSVVVGRTVVMPACPPRVRAQIEAGGFEVVLVDVSEFHLGGGSVRCMTNPLDIRLGRELAVVAGGRVVAPPTEENPAA